MKLLVLVREVSCSKTDLHNTKNFSSDNQCEVVEELNCFQYSLNYNLEFTLFLNQKNKNNNAVVKCTLSLPNLTISKITMYKTIFIYYL